MQVALIEVQANEWRCSMSRMINEALETMRGLHGIDLVNKQTLRDFETQCLPQTPDAYSGERDRQFWHRDR